jgi:hypothetical protein
MALLDHKGKQADNDPAVQGLRVPGPSRRGGGEEAILVDGKESIGCGHDFRR